MSTLLKLVSIWVLVAAHAYADMAKAAEQTEPKNISERCTYVDIIKGNDDTATCLVEEQLRRRRQLVSCPAAWRYIVRTDRVYYVITGHLWQVPEISREYVTDQLKQCEQRASR